jgi:hypothetical protein
MCGRPFAVHENQLVLPFGTERPQNYRVKDFGETTALQSYRLQLVPAFSDGDKEKDMFCVEMFDITENEYDYLNKAVFSDEATFHLSGKINRHNVRIWGTEESTRDRRICAGLTKTKLFCATSSVKLNGQIFLAEPTVIGNCYLDMF